MKHFQQLFRRLSALHRRREAVRRRRMAVARAADSLYLRDYRGCLYLYHDGRPIVPTSIFISDPFSVLSDARADYVRFDCPDSPEADEEQQTDFPAARGA